MKRQILFAALYVAALSAHGQSSPIVASNAATATAMQTPAVAPGIYRGDLRASPAADARPLDLMITASSADGRLWGYGVSHADVRSCRTFGFTGMAKPDGTLELEAKTDVVAGCERVFELTVRSGNRLDGSVWGPGGTFGVHVSRIGVAPADRQVEATARIYVRD